MKDIAENRLLFYSFILVAVSLFAAACAVNNEGSEDSHGLSVEFKLHDLDNEKAITAGSDVMNIASVRLIHGPSFFKGEGDSVLLNENGDTYEVIKFTPTSKNPVSLTNRMISDGSFQALKVYISKAPKNNSAIDPDFTRNGQFSMIVEGTINGNDFKFKSSERFETEEVFSPPLDLSEAEVSLVFRVSTSVAQWFLADDEQSLLNPSSAENADVINENIAVATGIIVLVDTN